MKRMAVDAVRSPPLGHLDPSVMRRRGFPSRKRSVLLTSLQNVLRGAQRYFHECTHPMEKSPWARRVKPATSSGLSTLMAHVSSDMGLHTFRTYFCPPGDSNS